MLRDCSSSGTVALRLVPVFLLLAVLIPRLEREAVYAQDPEDLLPGLVATYRSGEQVVGRLEPRPAFYLKEGQCPHPELVPNGWSAHWVGYLRVLRPGSYRFGARVRGTVRVTLQGREVLRVMGEDSARTYLAPEVNLPSGDLALMIYYEAPGEGDARLQLVWESETFGLEPLPRTVFWHDGGQVTETVALWQSVEQGRLFVEQYRCGRCHTAERGVDVFLGTAVLEGPDLTGIGERVSRSWIYHWVLQPDKLRPQTKMPAVLAGLPMRESAARVIAEYLVPETSAGDASVNEGLAPAGETLYRTIGCAACHEAYGDRGAVYDLADLHVKYRLAGLKGFLKDPRVLHPGGGMPSMLLQDTEAEALATFLLTRGPRSDRSYDLPELPTREGLVQLAKAYGAGPELQQAIERGDLTDSYRRVGRFLVQSVGCLACHTLREGRENVVALHRSVPLELAGNRVAAAGCLAEDATDRGRAPLYALSASERAAIRAFLTRPIRVRRAAPSPVHDLPRAVVRLGCMRCHEWQGEGGLPVELVDDLRARFGADHAEAVTPPPLTGAGEKLKRSWIRRVLLEGARARPWMPLRMPQFSRHQVEELVDWFAAFDGVLPEPVDDGPSTPEPELVDAGRSLVGNKGFGCIGCHDIAGRQGEGTRGPDLAFVRERIRYPWFVRWMRDAQRIVPGSRMPTVLPDRVSPLTNILGGDPEAQIRAIWVYLSLGDKLPLPEGVVPPEGLVLAVHDKPVLLRTFMPETSTRAIAVGLPGGVSYVFDAGRGRLAYAWSGDFLDVRPVWTNRGGDPAIVLGTRFWQAPSFFPWAVSDGDGYPDWEELARDPALVDPLPGESLPPQPRRIWFRGYSVDARGYPSFRVEWVADRGDRFQITHRFAGINDGAGPGLVVACDVAGPPGARVWFLAAVAGGECVGFDGNGRLLDVARLGGESSEVAGYAWTEKGRHYAVVLGGTGRLELQPHGNAQMVVMPVDLDDAGGGRLLLGFWSPYALDSSSLRRIGQRTGETSVRLVEHGQDD